MKFELYNFVQIKCKVCDKISNYVPGTHTEPIGCCEEIKKKETKNVKPRKSTKNTKEVS